MNRPTFDRKNPVIEFRVYYDPISKVCTEKSTADLGIPSFIIVDHATYNNIEFCENYIIKYGKVEKIMQQPSNLKLIKTTTGKFRTIKNNLLFTVDDTYTGTVDTWEYK